MPLFTITNGDPLGKRREMARRAAVVTLAQGASEPSGAFAKTDTGGQYLMALRASAGGKPLGRDSAAGPPAARHHEEKIEQL